MSYFGNPNRFPYKQHHCDLHWFNMQFWHLILFTRDLSPSNFMYLWNISCSFWVINNSPFSDICLVSFGDHKTLLDEEDVDLHLVWGDEELFCCSVLILLACTDSLGDLEAGSTGKVLILSLKSINFAVFLGIEIIKASDCLSRLALQS